MSQMQITGAAVINVQKISGFLDKLFNRTAKVNIGLMGDSTTMKDGHGWDAGLPEALLRMGFNRHGTGLLGAGEKILLGHGHAQSGFVRNAISSDSTTGNNGFTSGLPVEWSPYLTNVGSSGLINLTTPLANSDVDLYLTSTGALRPYCITADIAGTGNGVFSYNVDGPEGAGSSFSRAFEGITQDLYLQHWYLKTSGTTGGVIRGVDIRKSSNNTHSQNITIRNFNGISAAASGATFSFTLGATTTPPITFVASATSMASNVSTSLSSAGFLVSSITSPLSNVAAYLFNSGEMNIGVEFNVTADNFEYPRMILNFDGLTGRYYDASIGYGAGITTTFGSRPADGTSNFRTIRTVGGLSSYNKSLNTTGLTHVQMDTFGFTGGATRKGGISFRWAGAQGASDGISGPWCSLFSATCISGATQGFSTTTMLYMGSQSARRHARAIVSQSNETLGTWFSALAQHAGYTNASHAPLLIRINGGTNDRNEGLTSMGPSGGLVSSTREGIRDNWQAIINRVEQAYAANNWTTNNLYWLITPSPPVPGTTSNQEMMFAQLAAQDLSNNNSRVAAVNLFTISGLTAPEKIAQYGLGGSIDPAHHTFTGYEVYSRYEFSSIQSAYNASQGASASTPPTARFSWLPNPAYDNNADGFVTVIADGRGSTSVAGTTITNYNFSWIASGGPDEDDYPGGTATFDLQSPYSGTFHGNVTLIVTDTAGATGATTINIPTFGNVAPVARFSATPGFTTIIGQGITFTSNSIDSNGGSIVSQSWTLTPGTQTANTSTARFTFSGTGTYTVRLQVQDEGGATGATTGTVTVTPGQSFMAANIAVSPTSPVYDDDGSLNHVFILSATGSQAQGAGATISTYSWSNGATGATTSFIAQIGTTVARVEIANNYGVTGDATASLQVLPNRAPVAVIGVSPSATVTDTDGDGSETLIVSGSESYDYGSGTIQSYQWNTGATGVTFSQAFSVTGSPHTVWLIVGDNVGATTYISQEIVVNAKSSGPGSVAGGSTIWFAGKLYTQDQYNQILQAFYPNLFR